MTENGTFEVANVANSAMSVADLGTQIALIQNHMKANMQDGQHFGTIPGCGDKPTLLKPGAEKLCFIFHLAPEIAVTITEMGEGHREYSVTCTLRHQPTGNIVAQGVGSCSTKESKYRYRTTERLCPECKQPTIIKGKAEYGGGWLCWQKRGGCGAKYADGTAAVESQAPGKTENPDIADVYNTCLKMAKKRAQVDATLSATAASDIFTQDIEDFPQAAPPTEKPKPAAKKAKAKGRGAKTEVIVVEELPDEYILECSASQHEGKPLKEIPGEWLQKIATNPGDAAKVTNRDALNIKAYWNILQGNVEPQVTNT